MLAVTNPFLLNTAFAFFIKLVCYLFNQNFAQSSESWFCFGFLFLFVYLQLFPLALASTYKSLFFKMMVCFLYSL